MISVSDMQRLVESRAIKTDGLSDPVNSPSHYMQGGIECIDAIKAALTPEEYRGYCKGNIIKYIWRERHKGQDESVAKAIWYARRLIGGGE